MIWIRRASQSRPEVQLAILLANLPSITEELAAGCIAVFEEQRLRIRALPIGGEVGTQ